MELKFNYDFWIRLTVYPEEDPQVSKQVDKWDISQTLQSLFHAFLENSDFPEPHLIHYQLYILGQLLDHFDSKNSLKTKKAKTHLAFPDLALDKISGTDRDQDADAFIQLIERRINFALENAPANPNALANFTFRKRALFSF